MVIGSLIYRLILRKAQEWNLLWQKISWYTHYWLFQLWQSSCKAVLIRGKKTVDRANKCIIFKWSIRPLLSIKGMHFEILLHLLSLAPRNDLSMHWFCNEDYTSMGQLFIPLCSTNLQPKHSYEWWEAVT